MAGTKRPAPTLLPPFEPISSSPSLPGRSYKRVCTSPSRTDPTREHYPTPIPTSTTGILSSSPPGVHARPGPYRTRSSIERAPLSAVPTVELPEDGETIRMGRSRNSSHYQLSANRLISRVHIKARYIAASVPLESNKIEIVCCGWNGAKLHCQGRTWELGKGDSFTSETEYAEIMLDVQDARILITWPRGSRVESVAPQIEHAWHEVDSPKGKVTVMNAEGEVIHSSPVRRHARVPSPVSPTPVRRSLAAADLSSLFSDDAEKTFIQVYEDTPEDVAESSAKVNEAAYSPTVSATSISASHPSSQESELSEPEDDPDEENDPIIHSFGPFGANISSRMANVTAGDSPEAPRGRGKIGSMASASRYSSATTEEGEVTPIINHVANQLAFSRLQSTPLSVILNNLPAELKGYNSGQENKGLLKEDLRKMLNKTKFIGEIHRNGKDAAGKPLESEYYYIPDEDTDQQRKETVTEGLRKPSLRSCRKQHKQYYWKRPRTP
ncbi:transcription factor Tos4 protein [Rutstroemia sp. NJR-2017a WRK4]|nr:transcription factor Tos4 protein [Rutstroemia sp. NJR-2017a WRK4]